jgi:hypothetical protein
MHPPTKDDTLGQSISGWWYLAFILSFSLGSFICGAVLCERDMAKKDGSRKILQMDSPYTCKFKTTHQIMFTWEMVCLVLAAMVTKYVDVQEGDVQHGDKYSKFMCVAPWHHTARKCNTLQVFHVPRMLRVWNAQLHHDGQQNNHHSKHPRHRHNNRHLHGSRILRAHRQPGSFMEAEGNDHSTLLPPSPTHSNASCSLQVWVPSWIGFLVGVAAGAGLFFTINAWGIVVPVALLSPVWIFGIVRTGCFGLSRRFRSSDNSDHQELKD